MSKKLTREEAIEIFGLEKVEEVEKKDAEYDHTTLSGEERWVADLKVTGWLTVVYYQPEGFGQVRGDSPEDYERAQKEIENADWEPYHFEYEEG